MTPDSAGRPHPDYFPLGYGDVILEAGSRT